MSLIILDRDGVINYDSKDYIRTVDQWCPIPESLEAIARLGKAGHQIAIATNQSGVARGYFSLETLNGMHQKMGRLLSHLGGSIHFIATCLHGPWQQCVCRKPEPGLLRQIAFVLKIPLDKGVWMVGDSYKDLQAGTRAGIRCALVKTGNGKLTLEQHAQQLHAIPAWDNLARFVDYFLEGANI